MAVATVGFFDGVHIGHRYFLQKLQTMAKELNTGSVVFSFSVSPRRILHSDYIPQLLTTKEERLQLLQQTGVDRVVMLDFERLQHLTAHDFLCMIHHDYGVDTLLMGYDHRFGSDGLTAFADYEKASVGTGVGLLQMEQYAEERVSSTLIRNLLSEGNVEEANHLLGYSYCIAGKVVEGKHIGRTLGFPTANIKLLSQDKLLPMAGVYKVLVYLQNESYAGLLNIGTNPTVGNNRLSIEVYIVGFDKNIYGEPIEVHLLSFVRKECRFGSLEALQQQIKQDLASLHIRQGADF